MKNMIVSALILTGIAIYIYYTQVTDLNEKPESMPPAINVDPVDQSLEIEYKDETKYGVFPISKNVADNIKTNLVSENHEDFNQDIYEYDFNQDLYESEFDQDKITKISLTD